MVKLNYAKGWRFPGGGRPRGEDPQAAILRELGEEIGLTSFGSLEMLEHISRGEDDILFLVRDAQYAPASWSLEIDEVKAFALDELPRDISDVARRQLETVPATLLTGCS